MKLQRQEKSSLIESLLSGSGSEISEAIESLSDQEIVELIYDWNAWARPDQLEPPGDWHIWLLMTGRGWGKTRTGAEWVKDRARTPGVRIALIGRTPGDARDVMIEGESGLLSISPPDFMPVYQPSNRRVTWPNGAIATVYSSETPGALRGPQHHFAWGDELATWKNSEAYDNLMLGLRLGERPRAIFTTTPKPINTVKEIVKLEKQGGSGVVITVGKTYDNAANLPRSFFDTVISKYKGTSLGRQELEGILLEDLPGALWTRAMIDNNRVACPRTLTRVVVAIDPAVSSSDESDEAGIVVAGLGDNGHGYVLEDGSGRMSPNEWARKAVSLFATHKADRIVAEVNNGGDLVELTLRTIDNSIPYKSVHASRGKRARAEPVAALYEQGRVHHVGDEFEDLEDQMCTFIHGESRNSPDRMDALVWVLTDLMIGIKSPRLRRL